MSRLLHYHPACLPLIHVAISIVASSQVAPSTLAGEVGVVSGCSKTHRMRRRGIHVAERVRRSLNFVRTHSDLVVDNGIERRSSCACYTSMGWNIHTLTSVGCCIDRVGR